MPRNPADPSTSPDHVRSEHLSRLARVASELAGTTETLSTNTAIRRYATRSAGFDAVQALKRFHHEILLEQHSLVEQIGLQTGMTDDGQQPVSESDPSA